ncbi:MAG: RHS repeat-associated core domain-containing protein [Fimbriimonadaceae bacterium]|nr:RHS repeat-associated core domain-containing protein [Fimbriimonadaceae bacterium]
MQSSSVYDAYGKETNNGSPSDPFGYNAQWGYWMDRETGMYLCQARWYDPVTARWVNRDPIGYAGGANLYGYCGGGPVGVADPSGLREALEAASDFFSGWGDTLTLGGTKYLRKWVGEAAGVGDANEIIDYDSTLYVLGEVAGTLNGLFMGGAGGMKAGAYRAGLEFSHFVARRTLKPLAEKGLVIAKKLMGKCKWNGNYVTPIFHSRTDPYRYLKGQTKATKRTLPLVLRAPLRAPFWLSGSMVGGGLGAGHMIWGREE